MCLKDALAPTRPSAARVAVCSLCCAAAPNRPADVKCRFFHRVGPRPAATAYPELNASPVTPQVTSPALTFFPTRYPSLGPHPTSRTPQETRTSAEPEPFVWRRAGPSEPFPPLPFLPYGCAQAFPEWAETLDTFGGRLLDVARTVTACVAQGLGLEPRRMARVVEGGPHLLAPTGSDLSKHGALGTVLAGCAPLGCSSSVLCTLGTVLAGCAPRPSVGVRAAGGGPCNGSAGVAAPSGSPCGRSPAGKPPCRSTWFCLCFLDLCFLWWARACRYHSDLNLLTLHGQSRFPGLHVWLRDGTRHLVRVPPGCLIVQVRRFCLIPRSPACLVLYAVTFRPRQRRQWSDRCGSPRGRARCWRRRGSSWSGSLAGTSRPASTR